MALIANQAEGRRTADRWATLALLRFVLSLIVILGHNSLLIREDKSGIFGAGYLNPGSAVYGFFILSGYSIAASLERNTSEFYQRRVVRIWPLYLTSLVVGLLVSVVLPFHWPRNNAITDLAPAVTIVASFLMLQTVIAAPIPAVATIWSMGAEWWHYMVAPVLKRLPSWALVVLIGASFITFLRLPPIPGRGPEGFLWGLGIAALSWMWVSGFVYYRFRGQPFGFVIIAAPSVIVLYFGGFIGLPMIISIFTLVLCEQPKLTPLVRRTFDYLGDLSYPMYLFQAPVMIAVITLGTKNVVFIVGAIILVSAASLRWIDYPCRKAFNKRHSERAHIFAGVSGEAPTGVIPISEQSV